MKRVGNYLWRILPFVLLFLEMDQIYREKHVVYYSILVVLTMGTVLLNAVTSFLENIVNENDAS